MLFQFKNGDYYISGESEQKVTMTHVVSRNGFGLPQGMQNMFQNILISYFSNTMKEVLDKRSVYNVTSQMAAESFLKALMTANGVEEFWISCVYTPKRKLVGLVFVTWLGTPQNPIETPYLEETADRIGIALAYPDVLN